MGHMRAAWRARAYPEPWHRLRTWKPRDPISEHYFHERR